MTSMACRAAPPWPLGGALRVGVWWTASLSSRLPHIRARHAFFLVPFVSFIFLSVGLLSLTSPSFFFSPLSAAARLALPLASPSALPSSLPVFLCVVALLLLVSLEIYTFARFAAVASWLEDLPFYRPLPDKKYLSFILRACVHYPCARLHATLVSEKEESHAAAAGEPREGDDLPRRGAAAVAARLLLSSVGQPRAAAGGGENGNESQTGDQPSPPQLRGEESFLRPTGEAAASQRVPEEPRADESSACVNDADPAFLQPAPSSASSPRRLDSLEADAAPSESCSHALRCPLSAQFLASPRALAPSPCSSPAFCASVADDSTRATALSCSGAAPSPCCGHASWAQPPHALTPSPSVRVPGVPPVPPKRSAPARRASPQVRKGDREDASDGAAADGGLGEADKRASEVAEGGAGTEVLAEIASCDPEALGKMPLSEAGQSEARGLLFSHPQEVLASMLYYAFFTRVHPTEVSVGLLASWLQAHTQISLAECRAAIRQIQARGSFRFLLDDAEEAEEGCGDDEDGGDKGSHPLSSLPATSGSRAACHSVSSSSTASVASSGVSTPIPLPSRTRPAGSLLIPASSSSPASHVSKAVSSSASPASASSAYVASACTASSPSHLSASVSASSAPVRTSIEAIQGWLYGAAPILPHYRPLLFQVLVDFSHFLLRLCLRQLGFVSVGPRCACRVCSSTLEGCERRQRPDERLFQSLGVDFLGRKRAAQAVGDMPAAANEAEAALGGRPEFAAGLGDDETSGEDEAAMLEGGLKSVRFFVYLPAAMVSASPEAASGAASASPPPAAAAAQSGVRPPVVLVHGFGFGLLPYVLHAFLLALRQRFFTAPDDRRPIILLEFAWLGLDGQGAEVMRQARRIEAVRARLRDCLHRTRKREERSPPERQGAPPEAAREAGEPRERRDEKDLVRRYCSAQREADDVAADAPQRQRERAESTDADSEDAGAEDDEACLPPPLLWTDIVPIMPAVCRALADFLEDLHRAQLASLRRARAQGGDAQAPEAVAFEKEGDAEAGYLERCGVKVDVIAHSYGTGITSCLNMRHPSLLRRCVLVDPICFFPNCTVKAQLVHSQPWEVRLLSRHEASARSLLDSAADDTARPQRPATERWCSEEGRAAPQDHREPGARGAAAGRLANDDTLFQTSEADSADALKRKDEASAGAAEGRASAGGGAANAFSITRCAAASSFSLSRLLSAFSWTSAAAEEGGGARRWEQLKVALRVRILRAIDRFALFFYWMVVYRELGTRITTSRQLQGHEYLDRGGLLRLEERLMVVLGGFDLISPADNVKAFIDLVAPAVKCLYCPGAHHGVVAFMPPVLAAIERFVSS
ncbi:hypothetical protein BESB_028190 [Besnoitia besnoiti]|uniref:AB hydrolase-1 domain-containing protein n=1 Tax=Besnoitia besnoiti TaxID=94643 RepID=A0A2A9M2C6_BESBE|nr:uncharacterized protein BESB_028190 [Besnoitia besnoiti]PFH31384.1 hypothetical protein BESB_028190 [Besnoitia besnoiti]